LGGPRRKQKHNNGGEKLAKKKIPASQDQVWGMGKLLTNHRSNGSEKKTHQCRRRPLANKGEIIQ